MADSGRTVVNVLVTGATNGIGKAMAKKLVENGKNVYITGRDQTKLNDVIEELKEGKADGQTIASFCFDIGHLSDVRRVMPEICKIPFDTVIFNAGIMHPSVPRPANRDDLPNLEDTIKVNVLGHFVMARHLLDTPRQSSIRFVCLSSVMAKAALSWNRWPTVQPDFHDFFSRTRYFSDGWWSYFDSKLAAIVMAQWLNKRENVSAVAIHPGVASTNMVESIPWGQRFVLRPFSRLQTMEPVADCATRVLQNAVCSDVDFTDKWICKGTQSIPTKNLSDLQKEEFIKFLNEVTQPFV